LKKDNFFELSKPAKEEPPIPEFKTLIEEPLAIEKEILVSLTITEETSLQEVFLELASQANMSLLLDPDITGNIIFMAKARPFKDVVMDICSLKGLRVQFVNSLMKIEWDRPYLVNYDVKFLTISRESASETLINTNVFSGDNSSIATPNGSSNSLKGKWGADFWKELEQTLKTILSTGEMRTEISKEKQDLGDIDPGEISPKDISHPKKLSSSLLKQHFPQQNVVFPFSIHKQSGVVTVYATQKQHKHVEEFLKKLRRSIATQILIEAKVVEVTLKDEYKSGINWSGLFKGSLKEINAPLGSMAQYPVAGGDASGPLDFVSLTFKGGGLTGILQMMEAFGTVRTLSSPRLTVMNNQSAVLKVADNQVFFRVKYDRQVVLRSINDVSNVTATSTIQTVPVGFILTVHPSIDEENDEILLTLRPTITRIAGMRDDPAVQLMSESEKVKVPVRSEIPIIAVREIDSVLRMQSGQIAILGGLMQESSGNFQGGVPGTQESFFSFLTQGKHDQHSVVELVIFLKATIVKNAKVHASDKRLYHSYTQDARPFIF
jgi:general secretion pathway protein D